MVNFGRDDQQQERLAKGSRYRSPWNSLFKEHSRKIINYRRWTYHISPWNSKCCHSRLCAERSWPPPVVFNLYINFHFVFKSRLLSSCINDPLQCRGYPASYKTILCCKPLLDSISSQPIAIKQSQTLRPLPELEYFSPSWDCWLRIIYGADHSQLLRYQLDEKIVSITTVSPLWHSDPVPSHDQVIIKRIQPYYLELDVALLNQVSLAFFPPSLDSRLSKNLIETTERNAKLSRDYVMPIINLCDAVRGVHGIIYPSYGHSIYDHVRNKKASLVQRLLLVKRHAF